MYSDIPFMFIYPVVVRVQEDWTFKTSLKKVTRETLSGNLPIDTQVKVRACMSG